MRRLLFSLFIGFGCAFTAWAGSFGLIELIGAETEVATEHRIVVGATLFLLVIGLVLVRPIFDPALAILAAAGGVAALWNTRSFPDGPTYSAEYWGAIAVSTLVFMSLTVVLHTDILFRNKR